MNPVREARGGVGSASSLRDGQDPRQQPKPRPYVLGGRRVYRYSELPRSPAPARAAVVSHSIRPAAAIAAAAQAPPDASAEAPARAVPHRKRSEAPAAPQRSELEPKDELLDHNYDGIQEYDNPTPGWWHMIFLGSVVFSVFYAIVFHFSPMVPSREDRLAKAVAEGLELQFSELEQLPLGEERVLRIMGEEKWLGMGASIFASNCQVCHGENGEGTVGVNLTDNYFKNVRELGDITDVIRNGAGDGAMPPQRLLNDNEVSLVAAYVASLRGKNLPSARPPEGVEIPPFPDPIAPE